VHKQLVGTIHLQPLPTPATSPAAPPQDRSLKRAQDVRKQLMAIMDRYKLELVSAGRRYDRICKVRLSCSVRLKWMWWCWLCGQVQTGAGQRGAVVRPHLRDTPRLWSMVLLPSGILLGPGACKCVSGGASVH